MFTKDVVRSLALMLLLACSGQPDGSRLSSLSADQKKADMQVALDYFRNFYAPLKYKEERFGIYFEDIFARLTQEATKTVTDHEFFLVLKKLNRSFEDGHVKISMPDVKYRYLPLTVDYMDGRHIVVDIKDDFAHSTGVSVGDELLAIDGEPADAVADRILEYGSAGYDRFNLRSAAYVMTNANFLPFESRASTLLLKKATDGGNIEVTASWEEQIPPESSPQEGNTEATLIAGIKQFGGTTPFFYNSHVVNTYGLEPIALSQTVWQEAGQEGEVPSPFALSYRFDGKRILLLRIPNYRGSRQEVRSIIKAYELLLRTNAPTHDALVIDQTHNPGGQINYVEKLVQILITKPGPASAFAPRADVEWLKTFKDKMDDATLPEAARGHFASLHSAVEGAYLNGQFLAPPMSLSSDNLIIDPKTAWHKPILLLIDELCTSGGDAFPMLMKAHGRATLFGHRTVGMGGDVLSLPPLPHSRAMVQLTHSLFFVPYPNGGMPPKEAMIENNGVEPHIKRDYGFADFQDNYVRYFGDFSRAAAQLIK